MDALDGIDGMLTAIISENRRIEISAILLIANSRTARVATRTERRVRRMPHFLPAAAPAQALFLAVSLHFNAFSLRFQACEGVFGHTG
ncbi:hypothetical protein [Cupriavidus basilensis]|uniref:hypothetical protein n=1 Tax=Cupriavidus basilensis TaxID=68895 RepID=UPI0028465755|nr:hypothetical protein [Cupriavidus basilensis]MDR3379056.1 hypothetical protein [Cupriavidus basilensis]